MITLEDHPILKKCYTVIKLIEKCGASEELTKAVIEAGELLNDLKILVGSMKSLIESEQARITVPIIYLYEEYEEFCKNNMAFKNVLVYNISGEERYVEDDGKNRDPGFSPNFLRRDKISFERKKSFEDFIKWLKEK